MSVNKVILIGRCGKDPETRYMTNGDAVTNVPLATSESYKDKNGEKVDKSEWHNLVFYRKLAEIAGQYLNKGALIYVEGKIQTRKWEDKEGQTRYTTEIIVTEMKMLGGKKGEDSQESRPSQSAKPANKIDDEPHPPVRGKNGDSFDDDIPFMWHGARGAGVDWRSM